MKILFLFIVILAIPSCINPDNTKFHSESTDSTEKDNKIQNKEPDIEIIESPYSINFQLKINVYDKDWREDISLVVKDKKSEISIPQTGQSILFAQFVDMAMMNTVFFEVFDITHQGNGYYRLFEYANDTIIEILSARAVDGHHEGFGITCDSAFIIENNRLQSEYVDLNGDNFLDLKLSGIGYIIVGDLNPEEEKKTLKSPIQLERQFIWNNQTRKFEELINKRKGFWHYDKYGVEY